MFTEGEAESCPVCGVRLEAFEKLPPSPDTQADELDDAGAPLEPHHERLPATYLRRGRGALVVLGLAGLALFFLPWVHLTLPYIDTRSGFELAKRLGWSWAGAVAWVVLVPTVASRRTIAQHRGARLTAAFLSTIPAVTTAILLAFPPSGGRVPVRFTYGWPVWGTVLVSAAAVLISLRLGGRIDDIRVSRGTSHGQALH